MNQIDEYFTPTKLAELKTTVQLEIPPFVQGGGWEANRPREHAAFAVSQAKQELEVYDSREKLAQLATMIEDLKGIAGKIEEVQEFAKANGLDSMVSFCAWSDPFCTLDSIINCEPEEDAIQWMHSDHSC